MLYCHSWSLIAGITQWLERRTRDRKVPGSSSGRSGEIIFFSMVNFLCWLLFRCPFHPRVTSAARKRSRSFCQKCRWQFTAKHTYTLPMRLWLKWLCKLVLGWMVYTKPAPRQQQFHVVPARRQPKSAYQYTTSVDIKNARYKKEKKMRVTYSESDATCAQWVCSRAENSAIKKTMNNKHCVVDWVQPSTNSQLMLLHCHSCTPV